MSRVLFITVCLLIGALALQSAQAQAVCGGVCRGEPLNVEDCGGQNCGCVCKNGQCVPNLLLQQPVDPTTLHTADHCIAAARAASLPLADPTCDPASSVPCADATNANCCPEGCGPTMTIWNFRVVDKCCTVHLNCTYKPPALRE